MVRRFSVRISKCESNLQYLHELRAYVFLSHGNEFADTRHGNYGVAKGEMTRTGDLKKSKQEAVQHATDEAYGRTHELSSKSGFQKQEK